MIYQVHNPFPITWQYLIHPHSLSSTIPPSFCSIPSFTTFVVISLAENSITTTSIAQVVQVFRLLITPRLQSPILPLPTCHSLALTPAYHHSLIHSTFSFHSHIFCIDLPITTTGILDTSRGIKPGLVFGFTNPFMPVLTLKFFI